MSCVEGDVPCVEGDANGSWPYAVAPVTHENARIDAATKRTIWGVRAREMLARRRGLGVTSVKASKAEDCGIGIVFYDFYRKEPRQQLCHALVSELSFLCWVS